MPEKTKVEPKPLEPLTADELKFLYAALEAAVFQGNQKQLVQLLDRQANVMQKLQEMMLSPEDGK